MATFILVHGAFHGGWCWDLVKPILEQYGHNVYSPDLPSHGGDLSVTEEVTLSDYVNKIGKLIKQINEPVILVGHSLGGITITQTGENFTKHISGLIYLAAAIPANGQCRADLTEGNENSMLSQFRYVSEDGKSISVAEEGIKPTFYADCDDKRIIWAKSKLVKEPAIIFSTPVKTTKSNWGSLPRAYILCSKDAAILPASQYHMSSIHKCAPIIQMDTSHSPFFSNPEELSNNLRRICSGWI